MVEADQSTAAHPKQPGGGSAALRSQLRILSTFVHGFDFVRMAPADVVGGLGDGLASFALGEPGKKYAVYVCRTENEPSGTEATVDLPLDLPEGSYRFAWLDTLTGEVKQHGHFAHGGGNRLLASPAFAEDVALRMDG